MLINELWKIPFLRFILPFIAGILFGSALKINLVLAISLASLFIGLAFVYRPFINHDTSYHNRWVFGLLVSFSLFFIAAYITVAYNSGSYQIRTAETIIAKVSKPPKETQKTIKIQVKATEYQENNVWNIDQSNLLIYLEKDSLAKTLKYGDLLLLHGNLNEIKNPGNPGEFDYKKFLSRKQIYFQSYLKSSQWKKTSLNTGNPVYIFAYHVRDWVLGIYQSSGISGDEFAILAALTLGVKDYLSDEIVEAYSDSGAMHVLAVSGLHVGIIAVMLNMLLFPLRKNRKLLAVQSAIIITFLWLFALITGLAPSVTRSALMFSFFIIGKNSGKKPSSYNSLAAAAFIILSVNPNALFNVGFQLSFLAVFSILFFQPKLYRLIDIKNKWLDKIWQLTSVSIAAQIGTTPISLFYFHQFPVYALLTNIIVIPAAVIIMYGTVALIISSFYAPLAKIIGLLLAYVIKGLNITTKYIESIPGSSIEFISLSRVELAITYLAFSFLVIYILNKKKKLAFAIVVLIVGLFLLKDIRFFNESGKKQLIVFNTSQKSSFATISDRKMVLYADSLLADDKKSINYLTSAIRTDYYISDFRLEVSENNKEQPFPATFISIDTITATYLNGKTDWFATANKLTTNYLILSKKASLNIENLQSLFEFEKIIIDSSVPKWKQDVLKKDCDRNKIPFHNVAEKGAFVWKSDS
jgi:competence protein ComEC